MDKYCNRQVFLTLMPCLDPAVIAGFGPWREEIKKPAFRQAVVGEFMATGVFLFMNISTICHTAYEDGEGGSWGLSGARHLLISCAFGMSIAVLVFSFAGISGANINPAVSLGCFLTGKISLHTCLWYWVAQVFGAIIGTYVVWQCNPVAFMNSQGGHNEINAGHSAWEATVVEVICTAFLVFTVMAATDNTRANNHKHLAILAPLCIGMAVFCAHLIAIPVDNCSINPARSWAASLISGKWKDHEIFFFFPQVGALFAALFYNFIFDNSASWIIAKMPDRDGDDEGGGGGLASHDGNAGPQAMAPVSAQSIAGGDEDDDDVNSGPAQPQRRAAPPPAAAAPPPPVPYVSKEEQSAKAKKMLGLGEPPKVTDDQDFV